MPSTISLCTNQEYLREPLTKSRTANEVLKCCYDNVTVGLYNTFPLIPELSLYTRYEKEVL